MPRSLVLVAPLLAAAVVAGTARAGTTNPCKLVTASDARAVIGGPVSRPKLETLGLYQSCTYRIGTSITLTVQTRRLTRANFVRSAKANPGPLVAVAGIGTLAYSAGGGSVLLVWRNGTSVTFLVFGGGKGLKDEKALAKRLAARL